MRSASMIKGMCPESAMEPSRLSAWLLTSRISTRPSSCIARRSAAFIMCRFFSSDSPKNSRDAKAISGSSVSASSLDSLPKMLCVAKTRFTIREMISRDLSITAEEDFSGFFERLLDDFSPISGHPFHSFLIIPGIASDYLNALGFLTLINSSPIN